MGVPRSILIFFALGLLAASQSGNLIRLGDAHPVVIAAWRLLLAALALAPLALRHAPALRRVPQGDRGLLVLSGLTLAAHLATWTAAIQWTTVANATSVLALGPVLTALGAWLLLGERPGRRLGVALVLGLLGVAAIGVGDVRVDPAHAAGDAMAVLSTALFAGYLLLGRRLRARLPNVLYAAALYAVAGLASLGLALALGQPALDHGPRNWLCFALMAAIPTLLGHTAINSALRYLPAGEVALATLVEPPLAGLVAWWAWGEPLSRHGVLGFLLIAAAVLLVGARRATSGAGRAEDI